MKDLIGMAPNPVEELLPRAVLATDKGRVEEAIELYRRALEEEPENGIARNNLGCLLLDENRIDEALEVLEGESGQSAPNEIRNTLGYALLTQGDLRRAERIFRGILEDDPEDVDARNHLGMVLLRRGTGSPTIKKSCPSTARSVAGSTLLPRVPTIPLVLAPPSKSTARVTPSSSQ